MAAAALDVEILGLTGPRAASDGLNAAPRPRQLRLGSNLRGDGSWKEIQPASGAADARQVEEAAGEADGAEVGAKCRPRAWRTPGRRRTGGWRPKPPKPPTSMPTDDDVEGASSLRAQGSQGSPRAYFHNSNEYPLNGLLMGIKPKP